MLVGANLALGGAFIFGASGGFGSYFLWIMWTVLGVVGVGAARSICKEEESGSRPVSADAESLPLYST